MEQQEIIEALATPKNLPFPVLGKEPWDIDSHKEWFLAYAEQERGICGRDLGPVNLKVAHTFKVLDNATFILREEGFPAPLARVGLLAALYHDVARFEQYRIWGTFKDATSFSHGPLGGLLLRKLDVLRNEPAIKETVIRAVELHNSYLLPEGLPVDVMNVTKVVRDADKVDVLRVMDAHLSKPGPYNPTVVLSRPDDPNLFSQKVINSVLAGEPAHYEDLLSVNDFRLLLGNWVFSLAFKSSRILFAKAGHAANLLKKLPDDSPYAQARDIVLRELEKLLSSTN